MKMFSQIFLRLSLLLLLILSAAADLFSQQVPGGTTGSRPEKADRGVWKDIATYFAPPPSFREKPGTYRSPLIFEDGRTVKTKRQWAGRRKEILDRWHGIMGTWPALIRDQELQVSDSTKKEGYMQYRVSFMWMPGEETRGYLLVPDGVEHDAPAVITVYYEPETAVGDGQPYRDFARGLALRGFVTLSIGTSEASQAKTYSLYYPSVENASVEPLSMLAYAAANAWHALSRREEVDSARIGIMGHSFGGKWAMFASCLFEKFACGVWSDPGIVFDSTRPNINYWEPWYLGYHPPPWRERGLVTEANPAYGSYPRLLREGHDLHELHALMAPRPFLVSGGEEDPESRWIPLNHSVAVNRLLGVKNRVAMTNRPTHAPDDQSNKLAYDFLEYFLK